MPQSSVEKENKMSQEHQKTMERILPAYAEITLQPWLDTRH